MLAPRDGLAWRWGADAIIVGHRAARMVSQPDHTPARGHGRCDFDAHLRNRGGLVALVAVDQLLRFR